MAAAAVFAVVVGWFYWDRTGKDTARITLGGSDTELVSPVGEVAAYGEFLWTIEASFFALRIFDGSDERDTASPILEVLDLDVPRWTFDAAAHPGIDGLPRSIRWEVVGTDLDGRPVATARGSAWLQDG